MWTGIEFELWSMSRVVVNVDLKTLISPYILFREFYGKNPNIWTFLKKDPQLLCNTNEVRRAFFSNFDRSDASVICVWRVRY